MSKSVLSPRIDRVAGLALLSVALVALFQTTLAFSLPLDGFWGPDPGVKLLQVLNFSLSDQSIDYPAARIDPEHQFPPFKDLFIFPHNGRFYGIYSPVFIGLAAMLYRPFGLAGLVLLSLGSSAATMLIAVRLARLVAPGLRALAPVVIGLASPLLFYSLTFWEHAFGVALAAGALLLLLEGVAEPGQGGGLRLIAGGALGGLGYVVRPELGLWCFTLLATGVIVWRRQWLRIGLSFGGGATVIFALSQLYELWSFGFPGRRQISNNYEQLVSLSFDQLLTQRWQVARSLLLPESTWSLWGLLWLGMVVLAIAYSLGPQRWRPAIPRLVLLVAAVMTGLLLLRLLRPVGLQDLTETFPALCLLPLCYTLPRRPLGERPLAIVRALFISGALFTALVSLVAFNSGVTQWGPRYLLALIVPLTVGLLGLAQQLDRERLARVMAAAAAALALIVAGISFATQAVGYRDLRAQALMQSELNALVAALPETVVVVNTDLIASVLAPIFSSKDFMMVEEQEQVDELLALMSRSDVQAFAAVSLIIDRSADAPPTLDLRGERLCCIGVRSEEHRTYRRSHLERDLFIHVTISRYRIGQAAAER